MLNSKSGHMQSSPSPASYWPRYSWPLLSHTESEGSIYAAALSWELNKIISVNIWWAIKHSLRAVDFILKEIWSHPLKLLNLNIPQSPSYTTGTFCNSHHSLDPTTSHSSLWPSLSLWFPHIVPCLILHVLVPKQGELFITSWHRCSITAASPVNKINSFGEVYHQSVHST